MHSTTASVHGTNKQHDFHCQISHKWLPPPYIFRYYGPNQQEQPHGTPQEPLQKCRIFTLQPRRRKPRLTHNFHWSTVLPRANGPCFHRPYQPGKLSQNYGPRNRSIEKYVWVHPKSRNTAIRGIPMCHKTIEVPIDQHNWSNIRVISKKNNWPGSTMSMSSSS